MHLHIRSSISKLTLVVALTVAGPEALAQGVTGAAVTGTVTDEGGTPLAGAQIQLRNASTGDTFNAVTAQSGQYNIDNVPAGGPYVVNATAAGHQGTNQEGIQLALGQRLKLDLMMRAFGEEIAVVGHRDALGDHARTGASTTLKSAAITE